MPETAPIVSDPKHAMRRAQEMLDRGDLDGASDLLRLAAAMMTGTVARAD